MGTQCSHQRIQSVDTGTQCSYLIIRRCIHIWEHSVDFKE